MTTFWTRARAALLAVSLALGFSLVALAPAAAQFTEQKVWGGTSGGAANIQTLTIANMPATYPTGVPFRFIAGFSNTTAATLNISGKGAKNIFKLTPAGPIALSGGELVAGQIAEVIYDGVEFQLISQSNATAGQTVVQPQGYLTPCSAASALAGCTRGVTPFSDVTVGVGQTVTALFYTPFVGNQVPIYNGSQYVIFSFAELTFTLATTHVSGSIYDLCVFNNAGSAQIVSGPAWSNSGAGAGNRGTGAGSAQLSRVSGLWSNAVVINGINGGTTFSNIPANQCTYIGSIYVNGGSNGVLKVTPAYGQSRTWAPYNAYNRIRHCMIGGDPTAQWTGTNQAGFGPMHGDALNTITTFLGLAEDIVEMELIQNIQYQTATGNTPRSAIGLNSTSASSGKEGKMGVGATGFFNNSDAVAQYKHQPRIGIENFTALESASVNGTALYNGQQAGMQFSGCYPN